MPDGGIGPGSGQDRLRELVLPEVFDLITFQPQDDLALGSRVLKAAHATLWEGAREQNMVIPEHRNLLLRATGQGAEGLYPPSLGLEEVPTGFRTYYEETGSRMLGARATCEVFRDEEPPIATFKGKFVHDGLIIESAEVQDWGRGLPLQKIIGEGLAYKNAGTRLLDIAASEKGIEAEELEPGQGVVWRDIDNDQ